VLLVPQLVHVGENAGNVSRAPTISNEEIDKRMRELLPPMPDIDLK
jgi:hypothetical protein